MFVGLVKDPGRGWGLPDDPPHRPRRAWHTLVPWGAVVWITAFIAAFAVSRVLGGWEGYALMLFAVAAGSLRLDRQLGPAPRGMRDYQA